MNLNFPETEKTRATYYLQPPDFDSYLSQFLMKLSDPNIKHARIFTRNMMVEINSIYFKCRVTDFERKQMNPSFEN